MRSVLAWILVLPWTAWAVVRLLGLDDGWLLVALMAFTPWAAIGAAGALLAALLLRRRLPAAVGAATLLAFVVVVAPRAIDDGDAAAAGAAPLRVLTLNVLNGGARSDAVVALVRRTDPDVVALQELRAGAGQALDDAGLARILPHGIHRPRPEARGSAIYTRRPAEPIRASPAHSAVALRLRGGRTIEVWSVHPNAPRDAVDTRQWRRELRALPGAGEGERRHVLAGDFNATLDHSELRRLLATGYKDAAAAAGAGLKPTWPLGRRLRPTVTIDHILVEERVAVGDVSVHTVPGTDHRAVFAELRLPPAG